MPDFVKKTTSMEKIERIVLHVPHASPVFPFGWSGWEEGIDAEVLRWTDWYTDWLFGSATRISPEIVPVAYPFSRFFCDVERLEDDPLESVGQGRVYRRFGPLHRTVPEGDLCWIEDSYREHHERLRKALCEGAILVDCHSFPKDLSDVDVCIGVNEDWSRPDDWLIDSVLKHFTSSGYCTRLNSPYSNSVAPETGFVYRSLMIELNKRTYLEVDNQINIHNALMLRNSIEGCFSDLLGKNR